NASLREAVDLVLHQRNEWRDDHRHAALHHGRHPVADALSGPGGRDRELIASREHGRHDVCLAGPEFVEAKDLTEGALGRRDHVGILTGITRRDQGGLNSAPIAVRYRNRDLDGTGRDTAFVASCLAWTQI